MVRQLLLVVGEERALGAGLLVVHLMDVRSEPLGSRRLVLAQRARERLEVRVEMPLQAPVVNARPCAVAARVTSLSLRHASALFGGQLDDMFLTREKRGWVAGRPEEIPCDEPGRRARPEAARVRERAGTLQRTPPVACVAAAA